jgi:hypothetical protein
MLVIRTEVDSGAGDLPVSCGPKRILVTYAAKCRLAIAMTIQYNKTTKQQNNKTTKQQTLTSNRILPQEVFLFRE